MRIRFIFFLVALPCLVIAQYHVTTQNENYPLLSNVDSSKITHIRTLKATPEEKEEMTRAYLKPLCSLNDALACYLLATTYDKFIVGKGTLANADTALHYYTKAADLKLADACYFLYQLYRYNFMNQPVNETRSLHYLKEALKYGYKLTQAQCLRELANLYYPDKEAKNQSAKKGTKVSIDSTKYYLLASLKLDSNDTWTLDFLGSVYEDEKKYDQAFTCYMKSKNENSHLQMANWLATGKKIPKDVPQAVRIVKQVLQTLVKEHGYTPTTIYNYMGSYNPAVLLNVFYTCYKIITKKEVGIWYSSAVSCDDLLGLINE